MNQPQSSPLFLKWLQKNNAQESPVAIEDSFRNLQHPLKYIHNESLEQLQNTFEQIRNKLKYQKQSISDFSKINYRKVVSRENSQYKFGNNIVENYINQFDEDLQMHSHKKEDKQLRDKQIKMKESSQKKFIHNCEEIIEQQEQQLKMTFDIIKDIDSKDFYTKYQDYQFSQLFSKQLEETEYEKYHHPYQDISENYELEDILLKLQLRLVEKDSFYGEKSHQLLYKAEEQIDFLKRNNELDSRSLEMGQLMSRCEKINFQSPTFLNLLNFATGRISSEVLANFLRIKKKQETEMKLEENDQNLEDQYNKKKAEYQLLKELRLKDKNQKVAIKYVKNSAQTIGDLDEKSFDSYFEGNYKDLLLQLKHYNQTREQIMKDKELETAQITMLTNISYEIKKLIFEILCLILANQTFPEYEQFLEIQDKNLAEQKILELIYHQYGNIKTLKIDGIQKSALLNIYLEQREKNEKIFQIIGRMNKNDNRIVNKKENFRKRKDKSDVKSKTPRKINAIKNYTQTLKK